MSKFVKEYPDRQTTSQQLAEIEADLEKFRQEEEALDDQLQQRKKQFFLLVQTIHQVHLLFHPTWAAIVEFLLPSLNSPEKVNFKAVLF